MMTMPFFLPFAASRPVATALPLLAALLSSGAPVQAAAGTAPAAPSAAASSASAAPVSTAPSAPGGLTAGQIQDILAAEIAARRGDPATAHRYYLRAAIDSGSARLAELAVRAAMSAEDPASAEAALRHWLALAPDALQAHQVAAFLRMQSGDRRGALEHLIRIVAIAGADSERAYGQVAVVLARIPQGAARVALMQALAERFPEQAEARQTLAMVAASAGRPEVAERAAREALRLRPDWTQPRLLLVRLRLADERRDEARTLLEEFLERHPDDAALRLLYGQLLVDAREFPKARAQFERLLIDQPKAPDVLFALGILSLQLEDPDGARQHFARLYQSGERRDEAAFYLGQTEERAGQNDAARHWYGRVGGANAADAQLRMALLRARGGEIQAARELIQRLRDRSPDDTVTLFMVEAEILEEAGAVDEARAVHDQAVAAHPDALDLRYARALHAAKHGRVAEAERDLRLILEVEPDHADALNALGYTLADRTDRHAEALALIERAHALKPEEPAILDSLGWVHYRLGHLELALGYLRRALDALNDGEIAAHLGEVLWALGRQAEARAVWEAARRDHPDHAYLLETLRRHAPLASQPTPADSTPSPAKPPVP